MMGKRVLVVGASGAIGKAVADGLSGDGFEVGRTYYRTMEPTGSPLDVTNSEDVDTFLTTHSPPNVYAFRRIRPDIVVNCSGVDGTGRVHKLDFDVWDRAIAVNLTGAFNVTRAALPHMIDQQWGRIIHLSSVAAHVPLPGASAYAASKAGLEGFVRSAATDVAKDGVTINCVAPGPLGVGLGEHLTTGAWDAFTLRTPAYEVVTVDDVVGAIRYLIDAPQVTGQSIRVDGGMW